MVLFAAVVVGGVVGLAVGYVSLAAASDNDGWAALGAFIFGALAGLVAAGAAYVAGLVLAGRKAFPPGRRTVPVTLAIGIPVVFGLLVMVISGVVDEFGSEVSPAIGIVAGVAVLAAGPVAFAWGDTAAGQRRLVIATAAMAAVIVITAGAGIGVDRVRTNRVVAQLPLVLFEGQTAQAPFPGWRHSDLSRLWVIDDTRTFNDRGRSVYLTYLAPGGAVYVTMHSDLGPCRSTREYSCRVEGSLKGNEKRVYTREEAYGGYLRSQSYVVVVHPDGSAVSVSSGGSRRLDSATATVTDPEQVLGQLVRVDRSTFERETGASLVVR